jgi:hypothetical protein
LIKNTIPIKLFSSPLDAVLSDADYRLLPRFLNDPRDDHQRALLHVRLQLLPSKTSTLEGPVVDLYTVHYRYDLKF